ncbi:D-glycero-alpha-D-manno-heptose-1,7-bisphosphate 7-phosphatase [Brevundimonas sp. VNH65]|uniref:D-glycero-alpha-D-manno-heptose-1,7-bisphosphate 7-phosphatase n=1 Tax=Brevundimonas sp. VNH65 TaxID=3400917 RepID=UPI003C063C46
MTDADPARTPPAPPASGPLVPAAFLDRDGVLNRDVGYPHREQDLELISGAAEAVRLLNRHGFFTVIVTNQSGVARGMFDLDQMNAFNALLVRRLQVQGAVIGAVYACPYHSSAIEDRWRHADHPDRKPNPGMILRAAADHRLDLARSFMIGDRPSDMEAARRAGIPGFLFQGPDLNLFVADLLGV